MSSNTVSITKVTIETSTTLIERVGESDQYQVERSATARVKCDTHLSMNLCAEDLFSVSVLSNFVLGMRESYCREVRNDQGEDQTVVLNTTKNGTKQFRLHSGAFVLTLDLDQDNLPYFAQLARLHDWSKVTTATYQKVPLVETNIFTSVFGKPDPNLFHQYSSHELNLTATGQKVDAAPALEKMVQALEAAKAAELTKAPTPSTRILPSGPPLDVKVVSCKEWHKRQNASKARLETEGKIEA